VNNFTPIPPATTEAEAIASICARELASTRWSEDARDDLREIRSSALGVIDHCAGHEGFETAHAELERRVSEWAGEVDWRTFPRMSGAELVALSRQHKRFNREQRSA
jgi:hypothetical protein